MRNFCVDRYMSRHPSWVTPETSIGTALEIMSTNQIRHLPVIEKSQLVGLVSERDLQAINLEQKKTKVAQVMVREPFVVYEGTHLISLIREMRRQKYGCVLIFDDNEKVTGIFTTIDALSLLEDLLGDDALPHRIGFSSIADYLVHKSANHAVA